MSLKSRSRGSISSRTKLSTQSSFSWNSGSVVKSHAIDALLLRRPDSNVPDRPNPCSPPTPCNSWSVSEFQRPEPIKCLKINHINAIVDGYQATRAHFVDRLGFQLNMENPDMGDGTEAFLATLAGVMFELFVPKQVTERGQGRLLGLYGPHYIGVEYQVPD